MTRDYSNGLRTWRMWAVNGFLAILTGCHARTSPPPPAPSAGITLSWTPGSGTPSFPDGTGGDGYVVYRAVSGASLQPISYGVTRTEYDDTDVSRGTLYSYEVTARVNGVESERSAPATAIAP